MVMLALTLLLVAINLAMVCAETNDCQPLFKLYDGTRSREPACSFTGYPTRP
jgi:hypothetical protein